MIDAAKQIAGDLKSAADVELPDLEAGVGDIASNDSAIDIAGIKTQLFASINPNEASNVRNIKTHIGSLIINHAGTESKRLKAFYSLAYLLLAVNGYPLFSKDEQNVFAYAYLLLIATSALNIRVVHYADGIAEGCRSLRAAHIELDESLKRAYEQKLITRQLVDGRVQYIPSKEIKIISDIVANTWISLLDKHHARIRQFNDFRVAKLSIDMICALLTIVTSYKKSYPDKEIDLSPAFLNLISNAFFKAIDTKVYQTVWDIFKGYNPFTHLSFKDGTPSLEGFIAATCTVFREHSDQIILDRDNLHHLTSLSTTSSSILFARGIVGDPVTTKIEGEDSAVLKRMCRAVNESEGTNRWKRSSVLEITRNLAVNTAVIIGFYRQPLIESYGQWLGLLIAATTYVSNKLKQRTTDHDAAVKKAHKSFVYTLSALGKERAIAFHPSGTAESTEKFEFIKQITASSIGVALEKKGITLEQVSLSDIGFITTSLMQCIAAQVLKYDSQNLTPKRREIMVELLSEKIKTMISTNCFTNIPWNAIKGTSVTFDDTLRIELNSLIDTALTHQIEGPKTDNAKHANRVKRRSKKREAQGSADPDVDAERSYHSACSSK